MYRGIDWNVVGMMLTSRRCVWWMMLSMPFGIAAQMLRALRWKQMLNGGRTGVFLNAIFLSYASSLMVPRSGEVLRCAVVRRYEKTDFARLVGSVVTERIVDTAVMLVMTVGMLLWQLPVFMRFLHETGMSLSAVTGRFTATGWGVTILCGVLVITTALWLLRRVRLFGSAKERLAGFRDGLLSIRNVESPILFLLYSIGIWLSYYLHFWITFQCFDFTATLGGDCAMVAFIMGSYAVLVPTPNGAGPWHFAVKTVLMLYGVNGDDGAVYALIVHTLQTLLVVVLGLYSLAALSITKIRKI